MGSDISVWLALLSYLYGLSMVLNHNLLCMFSIQCSTTHIWALENDSRWQDGTRKHNNSALTWLCHTGWYPGLSLHCVHHLSWTEFTQLLTLFTSLLSEFNSLKVTAETVCSSPCHEIYCFLCNLKFQCCVLKSSQWTLSWAR